MLASSTRTEVLSVRVIGDSAETRLTINLSQPVPQRFLLLDSPRRAVIDLPGAKLHRSALLPRPSGLVVGTRAGEPSTGTLRLVFELAPGALVSGSTQGTPGSVLNLVVRSAAATPATPATPAMPASAPQPPLRPPYARAATPSTFPAVPAPQSNAPRPRVAVREVVVAIDAGHGGTDPGAIGRSGTREKDVVLKVAQALAERIDREPGMRAILTRKGDYFLTLRQRILRARNEKADMFVSVHADSIGRRDVSGSSVYVLSEKGATDEQARWLAERENAADLRGGVSLDDKDRMLASVLLDLSQSASISASMEAAERVLRALDRVAEVRKPRVQQAGFVVLKSPDIPSMLVETAYISNVEDERRLGRSDHRARLAEAIFSGVRHYFEEHPPEGTRFAVERQLRRSGAEALAQAR